jgi:hypothetical protein
MIWSLYSLSPQRIQPSRTHVLRYSISLFFLIIIAVILQQFLPAFTGLYNARIFLLLVVFLCISVTVPLPIMFLLALASGFLWDAQCALRTDQLDPLVFPDSVPSLRFGTSIILFGLAGSLMHGFPSFFTQGKWYFSALLTGIATSIYMLAEYELIDFLRGSFTINKGVLAQIGYTSLFSILVSPVIFGVLYLLSRLFHYHIVAEKNARPRFGITAHFPH